MFTMSIRINTYVICAIEVNGHHNDDFLVPLNHVELCELCLGWFWFYTEKRET